MSTRANVELYDCVKGDGGRLRPWRKGAMLYHPLDGYPSYMGPELKGKLDQVREKLEHAVQYPGWGSSDQVGALMVSLSTDQGVIPAFTPCLDLHPAVDYLWRVFLDQESWEYEMQCFGAVHHCDKYLIKHLEEVDWREEAGS
jgi:hypothetical protein